MRTINSIIITSTATPAGVDLDLGSIVARQRAAGLPHIGFHYIVDIHGDAHSGLSDDEPWPTQPPRDDGSIRIAYVGGIDPDSGVPIDSRTPAQIEGLRGLVADLLDRHPGATIEGADYADMLARRADGLPAIDREPRGLIFGESGDDVAALQRRLATLGLYAGEISGSFDRATYDAVCAFQTANGLAADGVVGRQTRPALKLG